MQRLGRLFTETPPPSSGSALGSDTTPLPSWAALNHSAWGNLKQALKGLSVEFAMLADKAVQQVSRDGQRFVWEGVVVAQDGGSGHPPPLRFIDLSVKITRKRLGAVLV